MNIFAVQFVYRDFLTGYPIKIRRKAAPGYVYLTF